VPHGPTFLLCYAAEKAAVCQLFHGAYLLLCLQYSTISGSMVVLL